MIGGDFGLTATVRHINIDNRARGELRQKHLYHKRQSNIKNQPDWQKDAHMETGRNNRSSLGVAGHGASHHNEGHVKSLNFGDLSITVSGRDRTQDLRVGGRSPKNATKSMHRGEGLSHFLRLTENASAAAPETLAPLEGHHSLGQDGQDMEGRWIESSGRGRRAPPKVVTGSQGNPLLEEEHLRILLGEVNSELMTRIQRAALALEKLWELVDIDGDGLINYYETKNLYAKWSGALSSDVDKHLYEDEKSSESKINYKRFLDIFMPLAMTVPSELILDHLSQRFSQQGASQGRKTLVVPGTGENNMAPANLATRRSSTFAPRKSISLGVPNGGFAELLQQSQGNSLVGENMRRASMLRKRSTFNIPDLSIGGNAESSGGITSWRDKMKASVEKISALKRSSAGGTGKRATVAFVGVEDGPNLPDLQTATSPPTSPSSPYSSNGEPASPRSQKGSLKGSALSSSRRSNPMSPTN